MSYTFSDLENKIVLITGATRGIGLSIAEALARQHSHVVFNYREGNEKKAEELCIRFKEMGAADATALLFDITNTAQVKYAIEFFRENKGLISGLVNNAGISIDGLALRIKEEDIDRVLATNLKGAIYLTGLLSRDFLKASNASVVNISSVVGLMGNPAQMIYAASKAGLIGMSKSYAKEMASKNVRCNVLCPGFIQTEMTTVLNSEVKEKYLGSIPLQRWGKTEEVASVVCFLLSQSSSYITGDVIKIDGGLYT